MGISLSLALVLFEFKKFSNGICLLLAPRSDDCREHHKVQSTTSGRLHNQKADRTISMKKWKKELTVTGLEPATYGFVVHRSAN